MSIKDQLKKWSTPLALAVTAILAYGLFAFQQGYYWDDWGFNWTRAHLGVSGIIKQVAYNRAIRSYWEGLLTPLLGVKPATWQIYFVFVRWATSLAFWWLLNTLWTEKKWQNSLAAFAFLLYPGLTQAPVAVTYQYFWNLLLIFFISIALMIQSVRSPHLRTIKIIAAAAISFLTLFGLEYLFGLELARIVFLWFAIKEKNIQKRIKKTAIFYAPYALLLVSYLYWRIFLYDSAIYSVGATSISIAGIWTQLWDALPLVSLGAWTKILVQPFSPESGLSLRLALVMGAIILAGTFSLVRLFKSTSTHEAEETSTQKYDWDWLIISIALLLTAGIPLYIAGFQVELTFPEDRFTFPFIAGVSLLLVWLLTLIKNETQRFTLAALIFSLAITTQIYNSDVYRREWRLQQLFAQQLFWRAPEIAPGTLILAEDKDVFPHNDDEAFAFLVNWAYNPEQNNPELDYDYFYVSVRYGEDFKTFEKGEPVFKEHLLPTFTGNTDRVLVLHFAPPSCLRILDPVYDAGVLIAPRDVSGLQTGTLMLPRTLVPALPLSNPRELITQSNDAFNPPVWLFGAEPEQNWCYYFEKADLARQREDWERVAQIGDKAFNIPLSPADAAEYIPFIEAYARLGRVEKALELTEIAANKNSTLYPMLCSLWVRIGNTSDVSFDDVQDYWLDHCPFH